MVKNAPDAADRSYIVDRGTFHRVNVQLVLCQHGLLKGNDSRPASLLVLECQFDALRAERRFVNATVVLDFQPISPGGPGQIEGEAKRGHVWITELAPGFGRESV